MSEINFFPRCSWGVLTVFDGGKGGELDPEGKGLVNQNIKNRGGWVNIEPAICNGHLSHP